MTRREEYSHLDDYAQALRSVEVAAEGIRVEAKELTAHVPRCDGESVSKWPQIVRRGYRPVIGCADG